MTAEQREWLREACDGQWHWASPVTSADLRACLDALDAAEASVRAVAEAAWDDGVRFAAEQLASEVYPRESARRRRIDALHAAREAQP